MSQDNIEDYYNNNIEVDHNNNNIDHDNDYEEAMEDNNGSQSDNNNSSQTDNTEVVNTTEFVNTTNEAYTNIIELLQFLKDNTNTIYDFSNLSEGAIELYYTMNSNSFKPGEAEMWEAVKDNGWKIPAVFDVNIINNLVHVGNIAGVNTAILMAGNINNFKSFDDKANILITLRSLVDSGIYNMLDGYTQ